MPIFNNNFFLPFCTCTILKKGLEKKVVPLGIMGHFFPMILIPLRNHGQSFSFIKFFSYKKSNSTGLFCLKSYQMITGTVFSYVNFVYFPTRSTAEERANSPADVAATGSLWQRTGSLLRTTQVTHARQWSVSIH